MSNVTNFTGPRKSATVIDQQELAAFLKVQALAAETGLINGVGIITSTVDGTVDVDWMLVPGADKHFILSGTQLLASALIHSFEDEVAQE